MVLKIINRKDNSFIIVEADSGDEVRKLALDEMHRRGWYDVYVVRLSTY